ncbi:unnamed protein product [Taenia asiatica]|uniref:Protein ACCUMULATION AND REPLICATION OF CHLOROPLASTS 3 n=1 Tax=Taenia asiatica TaxID=60517 RepID=A0A0R3VYI1_TAEAS|nr:unnamed protein product [Taenia asiatica]
MTSASLIISTGNQHALANSRLWDAISGLFYLFAHMQDKLSKDPEQLNLLHEFLNLQTEVTIMLLSMLEGNDVNGSIGRQMVDTLAESSAYFESNKGVVLGGKFDFQEFTERFCNPARDIGFNVALLLTSPSEHIPGDICLERLLQKAKGMLEMFDPLLGRIEITNKEGCIERVYFEVRQEDIDQWEKPEIKESKSTFLHSVVGESGDKEKLECCVNFAEDTIFEVQHAQSISGADDNLQISRVGVSDQSSCKLSSTTSIFQSFKRLITGLMIGALCLVKGVITVVGRFLIALASDPTEKALTALKLPPPPQSMYPTVPLSARRKQTAVLFSAMRTGEGRMEVKLNEEEAEPPDLGATNEEEKNPKDLASILQVGNFNNHSKK